MNPLMIAHDLTKFEDNIGNDGFTILIGLRKISDIFAINTAQMYGKKHNIRIPSPNFILDNLDQESWEIYPVIDNEWKQIKVCSSLFLPARVFEKLMEPGADGMVDSIFATILTMCEDKAPDPSYSDDEEIPSTKLGPLPQ